MDWLAHRLRRSLDNLHAAKQETVSSQFATILNVAYICLFAKCGSLEREDSEELLSLINWSPHRQWFCKTAPQPKMNKDASRTIS